MLRITKKEDGNPMEPTEPSEPSSHWLYVSTHYHYVQTHYLHGSDASTYPIQQIGTHGHMRLRMAKGSNSEHP